jgi:hypothetical protein
MVFIASFRRSAIGVWKNNHAAFSNSRRFVDIRTLSTVIFSSSSTTWDNDVRDGKMLPTMMMTAATALVMTTAATLSSTTNTSHCRTANDDGVKNTSNGNRHHRLTPSQVATEDFDELVSSHSHSQISKLPIFTADQVAENNGDDGKPIWVSYGTL